MTPKRLAEIRQRAEMLFEGSAVRTMILELLEALETEQTRNRRLSAAIPVDARRAEAMAEHIDEALDRLRGALRPDPMATTFGGHVDIKLVRRAVEYLEAAQKAFEDAGDDPVDLLEEVLERLTEPRAPTGGTLADQAGVLNHQDLRMMLDRLQKRHDR